jgi:poly(3-hydroxybutyrate) depolymerase
MVKSTLFLSVGVASALNTTYSPQCSTNGASGGEVVTWSDGKNQRCMAVITPSSAKTPMPVLFWFHGSGGNAAHCGSNSQLVQLAESTGFAYICGEAVDGQWDIPAEITDQTGTPCKSSDSNEVGYMQAAIQHLAQSGKYDTKSIFTSGCSMGSAFSGYMGNCLKQQDPTQISAFATHSTGLKYKGDGNRLPENWGECANCQWWPFAPIKYNDSPGLKACIFDNTGDGDFYAQEARVRFCS